jgi:hypothetical protein
MSEPLPQPAKPLDPEDYISHHLARQQGEMANYGDLLELDGSCSMSARVDHAYNEWLALKIADQEDLAVERMPNDDTLSPDDIPYPYGV